jgi:glycosyltransferase involved in cell wall biosynthesis
MPDLPHLPPVADQPLSALLLARDDAAHVESLVAAWAAALDGLHRDYDLILVDDGSADGTADRADALREKHPRLQVLRHDKPRGVGAALRTGLAAATRPLVFYTLCDPRYRPEDLPRLLKEIDAVHLVPAYRAGVPVPGWLRVVGLLNRVLCRVVFSAAPPPLPGLLGWRGHAGQMVCRELFGLRTRDVVCPYRLLRRDILARIPIQSDGPFAHIELLAKANFLGCVMGEEVPLGDKDHPVPPAPRDGDPPRGFFADGRRVFDRPDFGPVGAAPVAQA